MSMKPVRVVEPTETPIGAPYLALSHCWGTTPFLTNTLSTYAQLKTSIPLRTLPPNFRDAIFTSRRLGFRYIWIDSLCIIQDSPTDWDAEAPLMHHIYQNAFLSLAAVGSSDAYGGFFYARDPLLTGAHRLPDSSIAVRDDLWLIDFLEEPLNQRAWALQERLLAPRTVYFGRNQLFWECRAMEAYWGEQVTGEWGGTPYDHWDLILQQYTACHLTKGKDKFVALSGVVKEFERILRDKYLAGLWEGNFVNGLLCTAGRRLPSSFVELGFD
ncbi:heterokaryon incompatibility protein-domain-containing protein [Echria macrotheca]|uniref:Heterokaryon incompatibility protein-domain-containing protein n=1 Tax=Echria macrotheca TaxID=438768 RepID=A0AAJ0B1T6_9PEZI|nr:heterokaryon incompatibility protein-domain-containing protein [Echria macrotheca]